MLSYECIVGLIKQRGKDVQDLANELQITSDGLKKSVRNSTLQAKYVIGLCQFLNITPNELFEFAGKGQFVSINQSGLGNQQTNNLSPISALENQLEVKDKQIQMLLEILNK